eukprot:Clim_evm13s238 gene=Clim_evmTU13s238
MSRSNREPLQTSLLGNTADLSAVHLPVKASRQSLGPQRVLKSSSKGSAKKRRQTMTASSYGKENLGPRTPGKKGSAKRSAKEDVRGRRQSMAPESSGRTFMRDPRGLTNADVKKQNIRELLTFLVDNGYPHPLSTKLLTSPTHRDFNNIVVFLMEQLDPNWQFVNKMEEEIPILFKQLRYPFTINKSALMSLGSPHSWPYLLGALKWLVDLIKFNTSIRADQVLFPSVFGDSEEVIQTEGQEDEGPNENQLFFNLMGNAYAKFLSGEDNFEQLKDDLEQAFNDRNSIIEHNCKDMEVEIAALEAELEEYQSQPSELEVLTNKVEDMKNDQSKFDKLVQGLSQHLSKHTARRDESQAHLGVKKSKLVDIHKEQSQLRDLIDKQDLSPQEVSRLRTEIKRLNDTLEALREKEKKMSEEVYEREMQRDRTLQEVEKFIAKYNAQAENMQLIPQHAENANGVDFEIKLNMHSSRPDTQINVMLKSNIRPSLMQLRSKFVALQASTRTKLLEWQERIDNVKEQLEEKVEDLATQESKIKDAEIEFEQQKAAITERCAKIEADIHVLAKEANGRRLAVGKPLKEAEKNLREAEEENARLLQQKEDEANAVNNEIIDLLTYLTVHKNRIEEGIHMVRERADLALREAKAA